MNKLIRRIVGIMPGFVQKFYNKYEETLLYIFYGAATTVVSFLSQWLCNTLGANVALSTTVSWICAVTFAFFVNKFFVFDSADKTAKKVLHEAAGFYAARLVSFFAELGFMVLAVDIWGFNWIVCKVIIQIVILILNYLFSKFIIFRKQ
jgi:putative flippase GtrA